MRSRWYAAGLLAVALVAVGGVAVASIPDASGVIHGCRKNSDGQLRVIDSDLGQTCANGWTPLNWSQTGPQGPPGIVPPGTVSGVHTVSSVLTIPGDLTLWSAQVSCPVSEIALSVNGHAYYGGPNGHNLYQALGFGQLDSRRYLVFSPNDQPAQASVDLICATMEG